MDYRDVCSKIKGITDIEDIALICLNCSLQLTCQVKYLLQTQKRAAVFDRHSDINSSLSEPPNKGAADACDSDKPNLQLKRSILRRSMVIKEPVCAETECNNNCCQTKKVVRFADALGLELVKMSELSNLNTQPKETTGYTFQESSDDNDTSDQNVYLNRYKSYCSKISSPKSNTNTFNFEKCELKWNIMFTQPCLNSNFFVLLNEQKVALENLYTSDKWINGIVRVLNISFSKAVILRFTVDNWLTYKDIDASYITNSCDGLTDRFNFRFCIEDDTLRKLICNSANEKPLPLFSLQFAVCFKCESNEYWDNNSKRNYDIECSYIQWETKQHNDASIERK